MPGDPAAYFPGPAATTQAIKEIRRQIGLDRSLPVQFLDYLGQLARGDLGTSLTTGQPVIDELLTRLPASAELTLLALALIGESGSGKSVTTYAILGILDPAARITAGRIVFGGLDLLGVPEKEWRKSAGARSRSSSRARAPRSTRSVRSASRSPIF